MGEYIYSPTRTRVDASVGTINRESGKSEHFLISDDHTHKHKRTNTIILIVFFKTYFSVAGIDNEMIKID